MPRFQSRPAAVSLSIVLFYGTITTQHALATDMDASLNQLSERIHAYLTSHGCAAPVDE